MQLPEDRGLLVILVDGYNVIHAVSRLLDLLAGHGQAAACNALVDLCTRWRALNPAGPEMVIVLDGARPPGAPVRPAPGLSVRYMLDGADADIMQHLRRKGHHTLVSADGELVRAAIEVESPRGFFGRVLEEVQDAREHGEKHRVPTPAEVQDWLEHFGEAPAKPAAPQASADGQPAADGLSQPATDGLSPDEIDHWLAYFEGGD